MAESEVASSRIPRPNRQGAPGRRGAPLLIEIAWEACNKMGGIYTVLRSKVPSMVEHWGNRYLLIGPAVESMMAVEFEEAPLTGGVGQIVKQMRDQGIGAHYGRWLVTGRPHVVLINYRDLLPRLAEVKYRLWEHHDISSPAHDELIDNCIAFGEGVHQFLSLLGRREAPRRPLVAHFHEWMAGVAVPMLRHERWPGACVFTTHATLLGRYLAMNDEGFYEHLPHYAPLLEARKFQVEPQFRLERAAAHGAHVFTTVSDVTAEECQHLLGRKPDLVLPNGLNIQRFAAIHEFQNLHRQFKAQIHEFTMGHFFPSYSWDLDKTLYFFTSGRYEYKNKGMDLTIESLARLNWRMKQAGSDVKVVAFIITKKPFKSINVQALSTNALLKELHTVTEQIKNQFGEALFHAAAAGRVPDFNSLIEEYWRLRLRRTLQAWRRSDMPVIVTHDLWDDAKDEVLNQLRGCQLWNQPDNPVKIVYHPDFVSPTNPLFGMEYDDFVRGCHLGIFPSYYEPWGYTPLECIALGVPAVTSDLAGFGSYLMQTFPDHADKGMQVVRRRHVSWDQATEDLANHLFRFTQTSRRERVNLRSQVEQFAQHFDWKQLAEYYHLAHQMALDRIG